MKAAVDMLDLSQNGRRPWQLLIVGNTDKPLSTSPKTNNALTGIFDLFPYLGGLTLKTRHGDLQVTRDFPGNYTAQVDALLAAIFENEPDISGIVFPSTSTRSEHTATPDDPYWSPSGKALAAVNAAVTAGEISTEEAIRKIKEIHSKE